jgi:hypothetical protein
VSPPGKYESISLFGISPLREFADRSYRTISYTACGSEGPPPLAVHDGANVVAV